MTVVFVTHDQTEANALADRIAVMEDGVLQQIASPAVLKDRPSNLFVARFIGEPPMNVFPARIEQAGGTARVVTTDDAPGFAVPLSGDAANRLAADRGVHLGVRPHSIKLGQGESRATVISNQWLGDQTHVVAETAGQTLVAVSHGRVAASVGSAIPFAIDPRALHLFDRDSGAAIPRGGAPA